MTTASIKANPVVSRFSDPPALTLAQPPLSTSIEWLPVTDLFPNPFSLAIYGDPASEIEDLIDSVQTQGILVPLVVTERQNRLEVVSGHRRLACAKALKIERAPCQRQIIDDEPSFQRAVLEYNRQRRKHFSQLMREADALEVLIGAQAKKRRLANLRSSFDLADHENLTDQEKSADRRNSDDRAGRTDQSIAKMIGLGGKDLYRQARSIWKAAQSGDVRAQSSVDLLDRDLKTIHAAYKDLRRRDKFTTGFRPTPYDVWVFRHDSAYGIPHPGSIPPSIVAHLLHYYSKSDALIVDPMAGGGVTLDVCESMGRRCLAYDIAPVRPDVRPWNVQDGFPPEAQNCDLVFCDPPYHTMLARAYCPESASNQPLSHWGSFLEKLARDTMTVLRPGGYVAVLLANQTEKDLPAGHGYIDHTFLAYQSLVNAGFLPERRISCPMSGAYLPQHIKQARHHGRMLGQVRDLLVMRKPTL